MAIIKVTKKNFSKVLSEKIDDLGGMGLFASALMGGKDSLKEAIEDMPDEQPLWVNTDHVAVATTPIKIKETGDVVFRIYFKYTDSKSDAVWVKCDDYKRFILAWAGEERWLCEGEYKVPEGYRAISYNDCSNVKVEKIEEE